MPDSSSSANLSSIRELTNVLKAITKITSEWDMIADKPVTRRLRQVPIVPLWFKLEAAKTDDGKRQEIIHTLVNHADQILYDGTLIAQMIKLPPNAQADSKPFVAFSKEADHDNKMAKVISYKLQVINRWLDELTLDDFQRAENNHQPGAAQKSQAEGMPLPIIDAAHFAAFKSRIGRLNEILARDNIPFMPQLAHNALNVPLTETAIQLPPGRKPRITFVTASAKALEEKEKF